MKPYFRTIAALAAVCLLAACGGRTRRAALHNSVEAVEAEGYAPYNGGGPAVTAAASMEAQKNAIEAVAELFLPPLTGPEESEAVKRGLLRSPQLYVKRSKILSERREGDQYRATVRAYVYVDKIASVLRGLPTAEPYGAGAAAALMFEERAGGAAVSYGDARRAFTDRLSGVGGLRFLEVPVPAGDGDPDPFFEAARAAGADLVLIVKAEASPLAAEQGQQAGFHTARAVVGMKIYEAGSRKLLAEASTAASALDTAEEGAFRKAMASAGELLARDAALRTEKLVKPLVPLTLRVEGLNGVPDAARLKEAVGRMKVRRADFESYSDGEAVMTVYPEHPDAQEFASSLLRTDLLNLALESVNQFEAVFSVIR